MDLKPLVEQFLKFGVVFIFFEVSLNECVNVSFLYCFEVFQNFTERTVVYMVAQYLFGGNLVTVSNSHVVHLVAETYDEHVLSVSPSGAYTFPYCDVVLRLRFFPIAYNQLAAYAHACYYVAEFAVTVRTLVKVHEVHVDSVPRNFSVELRM